MKFSNIQLAYIVNGTAVSPLNLPIDKSIFGSPYILKSTEGLGPPDIDISISGDVYQGRQPQNREVVLTVGFKPRYAQGQTTSDLRSQMYKILTPKFSLPLTLSIQNETRTTLMSVECHVKRIDADIFSKEPQVQITVSCFGAYFKKWNNVLANPSLFLKNPMVINNPGDAPSGFAMQVRLTANVSSFNVYDTYSDRIAFTYAFLNGDIITFDTTKGKRMASVKRGSVTTNLLPYQTTTSEWLQLSGGDNTFIPSTQAFELIGLVVNANYWGV